MALADELDPAPLLDLLHAQGHRIALPTLLDRTTMQFFGWTPGEPLQTGPMGILQPLPANSECAPDLIITPLLGFDRGGGRIGYGAGHYDRAFQRFPGARRIGFAWSVQEVDSVPLDPWDVPLHAVVTELEFIAL
jgi:5-formyltetrahydrofolate cyclo-ligase